MTPFAPAAGIPITTPAISAASAGRSPKVTPRLPASGRIPLHVRMPDAAPTCLLETGCKSCLSLAHAEHRLIELRPAILDLVEVVVVHAADHLLHSRDLGRESVTEHGISIRECR